MNIEIHINIYKHILLYMKYVHICLHSFFSKITVPNLILKKTREHKKL